MLCVAVKTFPHSTAIAEKSTAVIDALDDEKRWQARMYLGSYVKHYLVVNVTSLAQIYERPACQHSDLIAMTCGQRLSCMIQFQSSDQIYVLRCLLLSWIACSLWSRTY